MVRDNPYRFGGANQVAPPFFEDNHNCEEFFTMDFIVTFGRCHTTTVEFDGVQEELAIRVVVVLGEYSGYDVV